jgi:type IV pilus assembly protein PilV
MNAPARAPQDRGTPRRSPRRHHGFTLVEVLITAAITIVAFTGLATMQILALRAASSTLQRSQATALAYDIVDRMRLNRGESGLPGTALGGSFTAAGGGYGGATLCSAGARQANDTRQCRVGALSDLTATDTFAVDLREWWSAINSSGLPNWFAGIVVDAAIVTVAVEWDDTRAADVAVPTGTTTDCLGLAMPTPMQAVCVMTQL